VASEALDAGASMINDISAFRLDPHMAAVAAKADVPVILMHMQGTPENMQLHPRYDNLLREIIDFLNDAVARAESAGIKEDRIILDPGIGFGKTFDHNLSVIHYLEEISDTQKTVARGSFQQGFYRKDPGSRGP
jgi:dihydropteroate synthase